MCSCFLLFWTSIVVLVIYAPTGLSILYEMLRRITVCKSSSKVMLLILTKQMIMTYKQQSSYWQYPWYCCQHGCDHVFDFGKQVISNRVHYKLCNVFVFVLYSSKFSVLLNNVSDQYSTITTSMYIYLMLSNRFVSFVTWCFSLRALSDIDKVFLRVDMEKKRTSIVLSNKLLIQCT